MLLTGPAARAIAIPIVENKMPLAPINWPKEGLDARAMGGDRQ